MINFLTLNIILDLLCTSLRKKVKFISSHRAFSQTLAYTVRPWIGE